MIDLEQIRELLKLMSEHDLGEIKIRQGDTAIALRKGGVHEPIVYATPHVTPVAGGPMGTPAPGAPPPEPAKDEGLLPIPSPMVGTVYLAPEPEAPSFVSVGREVDPSTPVCVIEAMKVFNEIRAEVSGTIERILVQNEQAVEFGQPLMLVRPKS